MLTVFPPRYMFIELSFCKAEFSAQNTEKGGIVYSYPLRKNTLLTFTQNAFDMGLCQ